jgi:hypothetical protein
MALCQHHASLRGRHLPVTDVSVEYTLKYDVLIPHLSPGSH